MTPHITRRSVVLALFMLMALCTGVYSYGLFGGFLFDDYPNIVQNTMLHLVMDDIHPDWFVATFSSNSGMLKRPVSMLSFAANLYGFGMSPLAFTCSSACWYITWPSGLFRI